MLMPSHDESKKPTLAWVALGLVCAALCLGGCDSDDDDSGDAAAAHQEENGGEEAAADDNSTHQDESDHDGMHSADADLPDGKTLVFYNQDNNAQYSYNTTSEQAQNLNQDPSSNFYMLDKPVGRLFYWPDEFAPGEVDEKVVMLKQNYAYTPEGAPLDHEDLIYLGHFHGDELAAHAAAEFDPNGEPAPSEGKLAALDRLNAYLGEQDALKSEIEAALQAVDPNAAICAFLVPEHEHEHEHEGHDAHDDADGHDDAEHDHAMEMSAAEDDTADHGEDASLPHYALASSGLVYIFQDEGEGLQPVQPNPVQLDGLTLCDANNLGSITVYGEHGVLVFAEQSQKLYLVDEHGLDYHQHSQWDLAEFMPADFRASMMLGLGHGDASEHQH